MAIKAAISARVLLIATQEVAEKIIKARTPAEAEAVLMAEVRAALHDPATAKCVAGKPALH